MEMFQLPDDEFYIDEDEDFLKSAFASVSNSSTCDSSGKRLLVPDEEEDSKTKKIRGGNDSFSPDVPCEVETRKMVHRTERIEVKAGHRIDFDLNADIVDDKLKSSVVQHSSTDVPLKCLEGGETIRDTMPVSVRDSTSRFIVNNNAQKRFHHSKSDDYDMEASRANIPFDNHGKGQLVSDINTPINTISASTSNSRFLYRGEETLRNIEGGGVQYRSRERKFPGPAGLLPSIGPKYNFSFDKSESSEQSFLDFQEQVCFQDSNFMFQQGPWCSMKADLGFNEDSNHILNQFNLSKVRKKATARQLPAQKVPFLAVVLKNVDPSSPDPCAAFQDTTGEMHGTLHREVWDRFGGQLQPGSVLVLRHVGVLSVGVSLKRHYLNITNNNITTIYTPVKDSVRTTRIRSITKEEILKDIQESENMSDSHTNSPQRFVLPSTHATKSPQSFVLPRSSVVKNETLSVRAANFQKENSVPLTSSPLGRGNPVGSMNSPLSVNNCTVPKIKTNQQAFKNCTSNRHAFPSPKLAQSPISTPIPSPSTSQGKAVFQPKKKAQGFKSSDSLSDANTGINSVSMLSCSSKGLHSRTESGSRVVTTLQINASVEKQRSATTSPVVSTASTFRGTNHLQTAPVHDGSKANDTNSTDLTSSRAENDDLVKSLLEGIDTNSFLDDEF